MSRTSKALGLPPLLLVAGYFLLALAPVGLAAMQARPSRGLSADFSSGIAMSALALLLAQFLTSGRFERTTGRVGIDLTMRAHQLAARLILLLLLAHPVLASAGGGTRAMPSTLATLVVNPSMLTGVASWILLLALTASAIWRDRLPFRYEAWRVLHGFGAWVIAALGVHHAVNVGQHNDRVMLTFWLVLLATATLALATVYVFTPLLQLRRPWRIASIQTVGDRLWELALEPAAAFPVRLEAGQFFWLTLARSPFRITEHPFSAASCPADLPRLTFLIKESGDFTGRLGLLPINARAYVDGPRGIFTLRGHEEAKGYAFVAGGVGVAPILGILRHLRAVRDRRPVRLLFGNRHVGQIVYRAELDALPRELDCAVQYVLSEPPSEWHGNTGVIDRSLLESVFQAPDRAEWVYFVCGPAPMMDLVERELMHMGVPARNIVTERFRYH